MKVSLFLVFLFWINTSHASENWIHTNATVTGIRILDNELIVYYKGGSGPCGGNGEYPFRIKSSLSSESNLKSIQSAVMFAYASNKLISVYGKTCETITQIRIHDNSTNFGAG